MSALSLRSVYFSYLHGFSFPLDELKDPHFSFLNKGQLYREHVVDNKIGRMKPFVKKVGQLRSALEPRNLDKHERDYPIGDPIWGPIRDTYRNPFTIGGKIPFFPCFPVVVDFLPSKHRTYCLNPSELPDSASKVSPDLSKMSFSFFYFPTGCVISRVGLYLEAEDYVLDPFDLIRVFKAPKKLYISLKRASGEVSTLGFQEMIDELESLFVDGICGSHIKDKPVTVKRFSMIDFADASGPISVNHNLDLISKSIESTFENDAAGLPNLSPRLPLDGNYEQGITVIGDRFGFDWMPKDLEFHFRLGYRRSFRNLLMLIFAQLQLQNQVFALEQMGWRDQIKSSNFLRQLKNGVSGPALEWPLSFMHCLQIQHAFDLDQVNKRLYSQLRPLIDRDKVIDQTTSQMKNRLTELADETKEANSTLGSFINNLISIASIIK